MIIFLRTHISHVLWLIQVVILPHEVEENMVEFPFMIMRITYLQIYHLFIIYDSLNQKAYWKL